MVKIIIGLVFLPLILLIYWSVIPGKWRRWLLLIISIFLTALFSLKYTIYFLLNIILVYGSGLLINRDPKNKKPTLFLMVFWLVGNLCFFKYFNLNPKIILPLGVSYITFRLIHYIVEIYRGNIQYGRLVDLALYVLFFPTFLAGPVDRFPRFYSQSEQIDRPEWPLINGGLFRIIYGLIKKFILANSLETVIVPVLLAPQNHSSLVVTLAVYGFAVKLYFDFSGYTDMAIGLGQLFGYRIMENFNMPFFQPSIALYWRHWHISVYSWIRDYFFYPVFGWRPTKLKIYLGTFVTMVVFTLWHKGTLSFLILGIINGLGLVIWQLFQEQKRKSRLVYEIFSKKVFYPIGVFLTFNFVSFSLIFFKLDFDQSLRVLGKITGIFV